MPNGMEILGYRVQTLAKKTYSEIGEDNVLGLAAEGAYHFFFSLFPIFLFLAPLLAVIGDKQQMFNQLVGYLEGALPPEGFQLIRDVIADVVFTEGAPGLISVGALLAIWSGSNVFGGLMGALNQAYDIKETRPWWKRRLLAVAAVVSAGLIIVLAALTLIAGEDLTNWVAGALGLSEATRTILLVLQFSVAITLLVAVATLCLYFLPYCRQSFRHCLAGGIVTTMLWILVTLVFRAYVQNFGNYNATYGTIGGVIVLLTWMYFSMLVFLIGGELASELHRGTGLVEPRRGVLFGDRIETGRPAAVPSTDRIERLDPLGARRA